MTRATDNEPKLPDEPARFGGLTLMPFVLGGYFIFRGVAGMYTNVGYLYIGTGIAACIVGMIQLSVDTITVLKPWRKTVNLILFGIYLSSMLFAFGIIAARYLNQS